MEHRGKLMVDLVKAIVFKEKQGAECKEESHKENTENLDLDKNITLEEPTTEDERENDFSPLVSEYNPDDESTDSGSDIEQSPAFSPLTPLGKRKAAYKKNIGRKRKPCPDQWLRNKSKKALNLGLKCTGVNGKPKPARQVQTPCACQLKCYEKFELKERIQICDSFWKLGQKLKQWQFIVHNTKSFNKKTCTINAKKNRNCVRNYFFKKRTDEGYKEVRICQLMFMNTLDINKQWITTAFKKLENETGILMPDMRGKYKRPLNETRESVKSHIRSHIQSFPAVESHYTRKSSSKKFLSPDLNIAKMFRLFQEKIKEENLHIRVTQRQYHDVFVNEFNIAFHIPRKDQCNICVTFQNLNEEEKQNEMQTYQDHLDNKNFARDLKKKDKENSKSSNGKIKVVCFDFQKQLTCPQAESSVFYYRRNFLAYNFTLFELSTKNVNCYVWDESLAGKGATEVCSCLNLYLKGLKDTDEIIFYSDNCPSQNKNKIVFSFYSWASKTYNIKITHRFLEQGHTQNEADSVHANIEREKKGKQIYVPSQWFMLIQCSMKTGKPYSVLEILQDDIFNFKDLPSLFYLDRDINSEKILWNKIREISVVPTDSNKMYFKYNLKDEYRTINLTDKKRKKKANSFVLKKFYSGSLPISKAKFDDMQYLCQKKFIPSNYHSFYNNLICSSGTTICNSETDEESV